MIFLCVNVEIFLTAVRNEDPVGSGVIWPAGSGSVNMSQVQRIYRILFILEKIFQNQQNQASTKHFHLVKFLNIEKTEIS